MTAEDANPDPSHQWLRACLIRAVLLVLFAAAALGGRLWLVHVEYVGGLNNSLGDGVWAAFGFYPVLALVSVVLAICAVIQVFSSPRSFRHFLLRLGFLIAIPVIFVGSLPVVGPGRSDAFERGYEKWILQEVDIAAIQQWLATEGHKYKGHNSADREHDTRDDFPEDLPGFFTDFKPRYTSFYDSTSQGGPYVEFEWGGPLAHWGFIVGLPTMPMPEEDPPDLGPNEVEIRRPVKPGVYVFERG